MSEGRRVPLRVRLVVGVVAGAVIAALPISQAMSPRANDGASGTPTMSPAVDGGASGTPTMSPAVDGGASGTPPIAVLPGSTYHALTPVRILDSVTGAGAAAPLASETPASFQVAGAFGVPPGATAIAGALSISRPSHAGYVALTAVSTSPTTVATSTASFVAGSSLSVGVTATLGQDGKLWALYMAGAFSQTVDIGFDLVGYYAPDRSGSTYHGLPPTRMLDSRGEIGGAAPLRSGVPESFQFTGSSDIP
ncbi:MAG: hypothetical protein ABSB75_08160, partial [Candidatus Limnocylindrales bacterium]